MKNKSSSYHADFSKLTFYSELSKLPKDRRDKINKILSEIDYLENDLAEQAGAMILEEGLDVNEAFTLVLHDHYLD